MFKRVKRSRNLRLQKSFKVHVPMRSEFFFLKIMFVIVAKKWGENIMLTLVCFVEEKRFLNSRFFFNFFAAETLDLT
jgi:hypothetical protein